MVNDIRQEFESILKEVSWMDETTRAAALSKAKTLSVHIGYPDELVQDDKVEEYYRNLNIVPDNLLVNQLNVNIFKTNNKLSKLRQFVNKTDWITHSNAAVVNAFYAPLENSIRKCSPIAIHSEI